MSPEQAARARLAAIQALQDELRGYVTEAQRLMLEGLLVRLQDTLDKPELLPGLLAEFSQTVTLPLVTYYAQSVLTLPGLQLRYFNAIGQPNYQTLRAPLEGFLRNTFGIDAQGNLTPGGYLATYVGDTSTQRALLQYAYRAQASGVGLNEYRKGITDLVVGADEPTQGLMHKLYRESYDTYNSADRALQGMAAQELGLQAFLYQGGLIESSRPFCKSRNGKVYLRPEIEAWKKLEFSGKPDPYDPFTQCGGYNCRHGLHAINNVLAMARRSDLKEDAQGNLYSDK